MKIILPILLKIAVIDSGIDYNYADKINLCSESVSRNYVEDEIQAHGTHISGLIDKYSTIDASKYCIIMYKVFSNDSPAFGFKDRIVRALSQALKDKVAIINMSMDGNEFFQEENQLLKQALDSGITVVVSAGNDGKNLTKFCDVYPACYDPRIIVVGNISSKGKIHKTSNFGSPIDVSENGVNASSVNGTMTGTSQSTAIHTGKLLKSIYLRKLYESLLQPKVK